MPPDPSSFGLYDPTAGQACCPLAPGSPALPTGSIPFMSISVLRTLVVLSPPGAAPLLIQLVGLRFSPNAARPFVFRSL